MNVVKIDFSDPLVLLQDDTIWEAIWRSRHPACRKLVRWLCHDALPKARRGLIERPGTRAEFDAIIRAAIKVAQRNVARRRRRPV